MQSCSLSFLSLSELTTKIGKQWLNDLHPQASQAENVGKNIMENYPCTYEHSCYLDLLASLLYLFPPIYGMRTLSVSKKKKSTFANK